MAQWTFKKQEWTLCNKPQPTPKQTAQPKVNPFPNFKATLLVRTPSRCTYGIENYDGMTEEQILNACDRCNFGGYVHGNIATVYTD
jgi:hypothetical protein